jgi:hypothetical protein
MLVFEDSECIFYFACKLMNLMSLLPTEKIKNIQVRWTCRLGNWSFSSITNPESRIISRQMFTHIPNVMWWSSDVLRGHAVA